MSEDLTCPECNHTGPDVRERACAFVGELRGVVELETVCDECERQHIEDI